MRPLKISDGHGGRVVIAILMVGLAMTIGCTPDATHVTLTSARHSDALVQGFPRSYIYREPQGDYHILLATDASDDVPARTTQGPLEPIRHLVTQRIMHIHVFWRPLRGLRGDNPSATNAAIDFYIIGDTGDPRSRDVVKYEGTAFVDLTLTPDRAIGNIQNGTLEPKMILGQMSDALGKCKVEGQIFPQRNSEKVRELLERIRVATETTTTATSSVLR